MLRRSPLFGIITTILVIVFLVAVGFTVYRLGYASGYASEFPVEGESNLVMPEGYYPWGMHHFHPMRFFAFGRLFGLFFFGMLILMLIKRLFWYRSWRAVGPPPKDWKGGYGPMHHRCGPPPWAWGYPSPEERDETDQESNDV